MRKGRGHDDRTNTTIKSITEEGGGNGGMMMTMRTTTTTMKPWSDYGVGDGEWQAAATALAVATRGCFGNKIRHPC